MASAIFQTNRTALITGGASGVGFAFAQLCQKYGMNVALVDKSTEALGKAKEILTGTARNTQKTEVYEMVCLVSDLEVKLGRDAQLQYTRGSADKILPTGRLRTHTMAIPEVRSRSQIRQHRPPPPQRRCILQTHPRFRLPLHLARPLLPPQNLRHKCLWRAQWHRGLLLL